MLIRWFCGDTKYFNLLLKYLSLVCLFLFSLSFLDAHLKLGILTVLNAYGLTATFIAYVNKLKSVNLVLQLLVCFVTTVVIPLHLFLSMSGSSINFSRVARQSVVNLLGPESNCNGPKGFNFSNILVRLIKFILAVECLITLFFFCTSIGLWVLFASSFFMFDVHGHMFAGAHFYAANVVAFQGPRLVPKNQTWPLQGWGFMLRHKTAPLAFSAGILVYFAVQSKYYRDYLLNPSGPWPGWVCMCSLAKLKAHGGLLGDDCFAKYIGLNPGSEILAQLKAAGLGVFAIGGVGYGLGLLGSSAAKWIDMATYSWWMERYGYKPNPQVFADIATGKESDTKVADMATLAQQSVHTFTKYNDAFKK